MNANELADELEAFHVDPDGFPYMIGEAINMLRQQQAKIAEMEAYQKHDVELAEAIGWEKGYEAGRQLGMKQERALWELAASTQEIENGKKENSRV